MIDQERLCALWLDHMKHRAGLRHAPDLTEDEYRKEDESLKARAVNLTHPTVRSACRTLQMSVEDLALTRGWWEAMADALSCKLPVPFGAEVWLFHNIDGRYLNRLPPEIGTVVQAIQAPKNCIIELVGEERRGAFRPTDIAAGMSNVQLEGVEEVGGVFATWRERIRGRDNPIVANETVVRIIAIVE